MPSSCCGCECLVRPCNNVHVFLNYTLLFSGSIQYFTGFNNLLGSGRGKGRDSKLGFSCHTLKFDSLVDSSHS